MFRHSATGLMPRSVSFVRAWVRVYTAGLPSGLRDSRREEIDADLWEQAQEAETNQWNGLPLATHLLLRWLLGLPDDLMWRLAHIRTRDVDTEEGAMTQTRDYKTMTVVTGVMATMLLVALLIRTVIAEIEYRRQADFAYLPDWTYVFYSLLPLSLIAIAGGFWFMRKAPVLGAILVTSGSVALAIMLYWLVIPELLAAGISFYAIRRAHCIQAGG